MRRSTRTAPLPLVFALGLLIAPFVGSPAARAESKDLWFHITVHEDRGDHANVRIHLPLRMVERMAPLIAATDGDRHIRVNRRNLDAVELREIWVAMRDARDAPFVDVRRGRETIRVSKKDGFLYLKHDDRWDDESFEARVPEAVVEALLSGTEGDFAFTEALRTLARMGEGELVRVDSDDATVRIWVDRKPGSSEDDEED